MGIKQDGVKRQMFDTRNKRDSFGEVGEECCSAEKGILNEWGIEEKRKKGSIQKRAKFVWIG